MYFLLYFLQQLLHPEVLYLDLFSNWLDFIVNTFLFLLKQLTVHFHWVLLYLLPICLNKHTILGSPFISKELCSYSSIIFLALNIISDKDVRWLFLIVGNLPCLTECVKSFLFTLDVVFWSCGFYIPYF